MDRYLRFNKRCKLALLLLLSVAGMMKGYAYSFSAVCSTGQTLYYNITDAANHYVEITYPGTVTYSQYSSFPDLSNTWTGYTKPSGDIALPESVEYNGIIYVVTSIRSFTFYGCDLSGELIIPAYVTSIGQRAFHGCSGLTGELVIPNAVTYIGASAFQSCYGFTGSLTIPNSVTYLGEKAFGWCTGFTGSLTLSNSVTHLYSGTFILCNFTGPLVIPDSMIEIGNSAFQDCSGFTGSLIIPNSVTTIGNATFARCTGLTGSLVIPNSVTSIGYSAFEGCTGFTGSLVIPNSLTFIDTGVFSGCSGLTSVTIPNCMTSIEDIMFSNCTGLISVFIPNSVTSIGYHAFSGCSSLTSMTVLSETPPTVDDNYVFNNVSKDIPVFVPVNAVQSYKYANGWNEFTNYHVIGNDTPTNFTEPIVFADSRVKSLCLTNWDSNGDGELSYAEATAVTDIGTVFRDKTYITSFDELQFFYRLSSINNYAFWGCNKLTSIKFPNTVTSFGSLVFALCSKLTQIVMEEGNALFDSRDNCNAIIKTIDNQLIAGCKNTDIPNSVTSIGESAFYNCDGLISIVIPNSVTSIGLFAFSNCINLESIEIPNSVTSLDYRAFYQCSGLTQIVVEEGNPVYDSRGNCNAIIRTSNNELVTGCKNTIIPNSVTSIGSNAFYGCSGLTTLEIPNSVTSIGGSAFSGCTNIALLTIMAETPPVLLYGYVFYNVPKTIPVYVPCGSIEAYQEANGWSEFNNIRGIGSYSITVSAAISGSGSVTGGGYYCTGLSCTVTAIEDIGGFSFVNWTENGMEVSTDASYTFTVTGDRDLVANFTYQGSGGTIDGIFPVGENTFVNFAQGNLQYQPSTNRWRFAEHQWDLLVTPEDMTFLVEDGNFYVAIVDSLYTSTSSGWIDLFGWGTSGYNHGAYCYQPWSANTYDGNYYAYGNVQYNLNDQTGMADWGYNAIINGGNEENLWRTLTQSEWQYLINHCIHGWSTVAGVSGRVIRPYGVSTPIESSYTIEQWTIEQNAGSVFLPAAGVRTSELSMLGILYNIPVWGVGTNGYYWSSSKSSSDVAFCLSIAGSTQMLNQWRSGGCSVRLVRPAQGLSFEINAIPSPLEGGGVNGFGTYDIGTTCTLVATPNTGYTFVNWTENGEEVSIEDTYSFTVLGDRTLVANFEIESNIAFADATVKALCVTNWDTDGDGELSYAEAAAVTDLGSVFQGSGITSFEELQYFTGLTSIGYQAFLECSSLTSIEIPNSVTSIGEIAFLSCSSLTSIEIPNSVISIGNYAFEACGSLTSIFIPSSVIALGGNAFFYCYSIEQITVESGNPVYDSRNSCNAIISTSDNELVLGCKNTVIPNSVISIGDDAFAHCTGLTSIEIPNSVVSIGESAFFGCGSLWSIELPNSVVSIGESAFSGCDNLWSIVLPNSVISIGDFAFGGCLSLTSVFIPSSVIALGGQVFYECFSIEQITVESGNPVYDSRNSCNAIISTDDNELVVGCKNTVIPNSVTSIGSYAFGNCTGLTSIELPNSVTSIGAGAFSYCSSLASVTVLADIPPTLSSSVFNRVNQNIPVYVPCGKVYDYQNSSWGEYFSNFVEIYPYSVSVSSSDDTMGSATVMQEPSCDNNGQTIVMATPNSGYSFVSWTHNGDVVSTSATYSFTSLEDIHLVANFSEIPPDNHWTSITGTQYNLTMSGVISIDGIAQTSTAFEVGAFCGDECRGSARAQYFPPTNEYVVSLTVVSNQQNGEIITFRLYDHDTQQEFPSECVNSITFVANANFGEMGNWYSFAFNHAVAVTATVTPEGAGIVEGTGDYLPGTSCTLTATANTGYTFVNWTENGETVSTDNPYTFTVNGAVELTANFSLNSYDINASANPTEGGTITGTGTYDHFSTCTLTATANTGYTFQSWSVAGEVVSTDNPYTFTVSSGVEVIANFELISYDITAIANPTEAGTITGAGSYTHGSTCTLTATANTGYVFRSWSVAGEVVSTENPYTFMVSGVVEVIANFDAQETTTLAEGWTWWSTSIELSDIDGLTMLEESLGHNGLMIKSANKFVQNYYPSTGYDYWFGQLTSDDFTNASSYMIQTSASCEVTMTGTYADPSDHPIQLYPGWTWIGYPCGSQQSATSAFAGFTPMNNDKVKGQFSFATYYDNYGWFPEFTMTPGEGYLYQSLASDTRTLTFANGSKDNPQPAKEEDRYWRNNIHAYADNMNVIAVVTINDEEQQGEDLELGAFVGGECRGSAVLKYFQPTDRWYAMLTVTGADGDQIDFRIIDKGKGLTSMTSNRSLVFQSNAVVGELDEPYTIDFGTLGCVENNLMGAMHIYPNPIDRNTTFSIVVPETETVRSIYIVNMMGEVVAHETNLTRSLSLQATGVYTIKVVCHSGNVYVGKLIVK